MANINEWLSVDKVNGTGDAIVTLTAPINYERINRTAKLKISCDTQTRYVNISQDTHNFNYDKYLWVKLEQDGEVYGIKSDTIQYSFDQNIWNDFIPSKRLSVPANTYVWFRNTSNVLNENLVMQFTQNKILFSTNGRVGGDLSSMGDMRKRNFAELFSANTDEYYYKLIDASELILPWDEVSDHCFYRMFYNCYNLETAPKILPATTLSKYSYYGMFIGCTSLTTAPEISATTLADNCCESMFSGCTSLTTAPKILPATTLKYNCYVSMFWDCTSLTIAPEISATTLAGNCCESMFSGCTSLTTAPKILPATTLVYNCYGSMFWGCTSLTTAPELPATTLADSCYENMFRGCTSLTTAPELPATTLAYRCYNYMFKSCTSLSYIKMLAREVLDSDEYLLNWVQNVAPSGIFVKHESSVLYWGINGVPYNWKVEIATA